MKINANGASQPSSSPGQLAPLLVMVQPRLLAGPVALLVHELQNHVDSRVDEYLPEFHKKEWGKSEPEKLQNRQPRLNSIPRNAASP